MIGYILLSLVKILDNIILTVKTIATYKEQRILSSVLVIISQLIFYLVINHVINDDTILAIIIVSVSSGVGNLLAFLLMISLNVIQNGHLLSHHLMLMILRRCAIILRQIKLNTLPMMVITEEANLQLTLWLLAKLKMTVG